MFLRFITAIILCFSFFLARAQSDFVSNKFTIHADESYLADSLLARADLNKMLSFSLFVNKDEPLVEWNSLFGSLGFKYKDIFSYSTYTYPKRTYSPMIGGDTLVGATLYFVLPARFNISESMFDNVSNIQNKYEFTYEGVDFKRIQTKDSFTLYRIWKHHEKNGACTSLIPEFIALKKPLERMLSVYKVWFDEEANKENTKTTQETKRVLDRQGKIIDDLNSSLSQLKTRLLNIESRPSLILGLTYFINRAAKPIENEGSISRFSHAGQSFGIDIYSISKGLTRKKPSLGFHAGLKISDGTMDFQSASFTNSFDAKDVYGNTYVRKNYYTDWQERLRARFLEVPLGFCYYPVFKEHQMLRIELAPTLVFVSSVEDRLLRGQLSTRAQYKGIKDELANVEDLGLKDDQVLADMTLFSYSNQKYITASIAAAYYQAIYKNLFVYGSLGFTVHPNFIKSLEADKSAMSNQDVLSAFALKTNPIYSPGRLHLGLGIAFKIN